MWDIFRSEALEKLQELEEALLNIESQGSDTDSISAMYRAVHTFKGNSRIMGLSQLENLAHQAEDLMGLVRDRSLPFDTGLAQIFFQVLDVFRVLVDEVVEQQADIDPNQVSALYGVLENAVNHYRNQLDGPGAEGEQTPEPDASDTDALDEMFEGIYFELILQDQERLKTKLNAAIEGDEAAFAEVLEIFETWLHATENLQETLALESLQAAYDAFQRGDFSTLNDALTAFYRCLKLPTDATQAAGEQESSSGSDYPAEQFFFQFLETELSLLSEGLQAPGEESDRTLLDEASQNLLEAAQHYAYPRLISLCHSLRVCLLESEDPQLLKELEYRLFNELISIHESLQSRYPELENTNSQRMLVFQQWHAHRLYQYIRQLRQDVQAMRQNGIENAQTVSSCASLLNHIHHASLFYQLEDAAQLSLILQDHFLRSKPSIPPSRVLEQSLAFCELLIQALDEPDTQREDAFLNLIPALQDIKSEQGGRAQAWITTLQLNPAFIEVLNAENIAQLERARTRKQHYYVLQTPLPEHSAQALYDWLEDDLIENISNITLYRNDHSEFQFLFCSSLTLQEVQLNVSRIDPQGLMAIQEHIPQERADQSGSELPSPKGAQGANAALSSAARLDPQPAKADESKTQLAQNAHKIVENFLKVDLNKVNRLMDLTGEIGLAAGAVLSHPELQALDLTGFQIQAQNLMALIRELQGEASSLRLVPISVMFKRMERLVRDLKQSTQKEVELVLLGESTEIDKVMIDKLYDPLVHMIRNAVDHGIELPDEREKQGKPRAGKLVLHARHQAGEVVISLHDDGRGLDQAAILARAQDLGLVQAGEELDEQDIFKLIFQAGFSTAQSLSNLSGRGVGMDVVQHTMTELRGRHKIQSTPGQGTQISLHLPLTLAFIEGMIIEVNATRYAIPIESVHEVFKVNMQKVTHLATERTEVIQVRDELIPTCWLEKFYDTQEQSCELNHDKVIVVTQTSSGNLAIPVDRLLGNQQVTLKPLTGILKNIRAGAGYGLLSSGDVAIVLDCERLHAS